MRQTPCPAIHKSDYIITSFSLWKKHIVRSFFPQFPFPCILFSFFCSFLHLWCLTLSSFPAKHDIRCSFLEALHSYNQRLFHSMHNNFCLSITYGITAFSTRDYSSLLAVERDISKATSFKPWGMCMEQHWLHVNLWKSCWGHISQVLQYCDHPAWYNSAPGHIEFIPSSVQKVPPFLWGQTTCVTPMNLA